MTFPTDHLQAGMEAALEQARLAQCEGDFAYGAVVVSRSGQIVAHAQDRVLRDRDATSHAEIEAVRLATRLLGIDLRDCALVSNVEPCAMCSTAAWWAQIDTVAFGMRQAELHSIRPDTMGEPGLTVEQAQSPFRRKMAVIALAPTPAARMLWRTTPCT
jgi:tRNA(Arg) A34 adenosine deaminase TadA